MYAVTIIPVFHIYTNIKMAEKIQIYIMNEELKVQKSEYVLCD